MNPAQHTCTMLLSFTPIDARYLGDTPPTHLRIIFHLENDIAANHITITRSETFLKDSPSVMLVFSEELYESDVMCLTRYKLKGLYVQHI
jgi:hypothetical protein